MNRSQAGVLPGIHSTQHGVQMQKGAMSRDKDRRVHIPEERDTSKRDYRLLAVGSEVEHGRQKHKVIECPKCGKPGIEMTGELHKLRTVIHAVRRFRNVYRKDAACTFPR